MFLCSGAEAGRDGVGDYTRALAQECMRHGHKAAVIALSDHAVSETARLDQPLISLRLAAQRSWDSRCETAAAFADEFAPDMASLQYVPFGFDRRGLPFQFTTRLKKALRSTPVQIMFHELWTGAERGARIADRLRGAIQQRIICDMWRRLDPLVMHTSNSVYQALLGEAGLTAKTLPMFGAIPIESNPDYSWIYERAGGREKCENSLVCCIFGTLHPVWPPEPLLTLLQEAAKRMGKGLLLAAIGNMGSGASLWRSLKSRYSQISFWEMGEQTTARISAFFSLCDFGIATTPLALIGKSSSVVAMIEHGLPVIVNRDEIHFSCCAMPQEESPLIIPLKSDLPDKLPLIKRQAPSSRLPAVTRQFLNDLADVQ